MQRLAKVLKDESKNRTKKWLSAQDAYTLHRPVRRRFRRRRTIVRGPGVQVQADLMDVSSHAEHNDGIRFLLTIVDAFSRFAWAVPLRNKGGKEVARGLRETLAGLNYETLQTDKGTEFRNDHVRTFLQEEGMRWFSSQDDAIKASLVERFNKTLRGKIHAFLTRTRKRKRHRHPTTTQHTTTPRFESFQPEFSPSTTRLGKTYGPVKNRRGHSWTPDEWRTPPTLRWQTLPNRRH